MVFRALITGQGRGICPSSRFETGQRYLVIDRAGDEPNCDEHTLDEPVMVLEP